MWNFVRTVALWAVAASPLLLATGPASAQAQPAPTAATRYIDAGRLAARPLRGLAEYAAALEQLDREFKARGSEIEALYSRFHAAEAQARESGNSPKLVDEARAIEADYKAKKAAGEQALAARQRELIGPITARIVEAAKRFRVARGIVDLRFAENYVQAGEMETAGASDVTDDFVTWYAANPAP